jgi:hypothetical protein
MNFLPLVPISSSLNSSIPLYLKYFLNIGSTSLYFVYINNKENAKGKIIKYIIGSYDLRHGVSLFNVRKIHILESQIEYNEFEQILGRTLRICSHYHLSQKYRNVQYTLWISYKHIFAKTEDMNTYKISLTYDVINKKFLRALKEIAVDRYLWNLEKMKTFVSFVLDEYSKILGIKYEK